MVRGDVYLKVKIAKIKMTRFYNLKINEIPLKEGNLILMKMETTKKGSIQGKLTLN